MPGGTGQAAAQDPGQGREVPGACCRAGAADSAQGQAGAGRAPASPPCSLLSQCPWRDDDEEEEADASTSVTAMASLMLNTGKSASPGSRCDALAC